MFCRVFIVFVLACVSVSQSSDQIILDDDSEDSPLSMTCMKCICKVMGCRKDEGCEDKVCGVMHITQGYWETAHYRNSSPDNLAAFQKCTTNVWCATRTVQLHMRRYLPGCERRRLDRLRCVNALALHKFGPNRCDRNLTASNERKLLTCLHKTVWVWLSDHEDE